MQAAAAIRVVVVEIFTVTVAAFVGSLAAIGRLDDWRGSSVFLHSSWQ